MSLDPIGVALRVAEVLDALEIEYLVGGSVAASLTGISRTTLDIEFEPDPLRIRDEGRSVRRS